MTHLFCVHNHLLQRFAKTAKNNKVKKEIWQKVKEEKEIKIDQQANTISHLYTKNENEINVKKVLTAECQHTVLK